MLYIIIKSDLNLGLIISIINSGYLTLDLFSSPNDVEEVPTFIIEETVIGSY